MTGQYGLLSPLWAGTAAAADTSDEAVLLALLQVEAAWAETLAVAGAVPESSAAAIRTLWRRQQESSTAPFDAQVLAAAAPGGGNPVIPLVKLMRQTLASEGCSDSALHRGATSQDILDTALRLVIGQVSKDISRHAVRICDALAALADDHRHTLCVARSLTQHALPTTFGLRAAGWLDGVQQAIGALHTSLDSMPLQWGGAVGTRAALVDWQGSEDAHQLILDLATRLGLPAGRPWHSQRQPALRVASSLAGVLAALGKLAGDVLLLQRPEIGELRESAAPGRGGSSAMPHKQNPVQSVLIRSAANAAPNLLATMYAAASSAQDERPDGAWHAEWPALAELLRLAAGASQRAADLVSGLETFPEQMQKNLQSAGDVLLSERLALRLGPLLPGGSKALQTAVEQSVSSDLPLREILADLLRSAEPTGEREEALEELDGLLDPAGYLGHAEDLTDSVLADYQQNRSAWNE
ncbi:lyase family protein [Nesterenkonia ebinurensis]|uniref:lyase family protein n=1 Tax=Nesterenkonia ebinurensis TaxID=2608252 RepID=UPI00123E2897|nr:lyase family protein [Nesterenkonia ebinurensis]